MNSPLKVTHAEAYPEGTRPVDSVMTREQFRAMGFAEIRRRVRLMFPSYSRREVNQLARDMFKRAWAERDKAAIAKRTRENPVGLGVGLRPLR